MRLMPAALLAMPAAVLAHEAAVAVPWHPLQWAWALLWAAAVLAWWRGARRTRIARRRALAWHAALALGAAALFGPLDERAATNAAWHMVQHMLLLQAVAPLLVVAAPLRAWRAAVGPLLDAPARALSRASRHPMACALLQAAAIWSWHAPGPYRLALQHGGWHVVEHASFLFAASLFWWSVLRAGRSGALAALLALLFTHTHTGMLGALLAFAPLPLIVDSADALADQQLAGLLMWVPGGLAYLGAGALLAGRLLLQRRAPPRLQPRVSSPAPSAARHR